MLCGIREEDSSERRFFWFAVIYRAFSAFRFASNSKELNSVADVVFLGNFCSCKRISFNDVSKLVIVNFQWLTTILFIFKAVISFAKLLEPTLHCMFVRSSWAKCVVAVLLSLLFYLPFWTQIRKLLEFTFCLTSVP